MNNSPRRGTPKSKRKPVPSGMRLRKLSPDTIDAPSVKEPRVWNATTSHPPQDVCPECGYPEARAGYCPECGYSAPITLAPQGSAHGRQWDINGNRIN